MLVVHGFVTLCTWELAGGLGGLAIQIVLAAALSRAGERRLAALDPELLALQARTSADLDRVGLRAIAPREVRARR